MKLASLKSGRDGRLVVVSRDLAWCADAGHIARTLQAALDDWDHVAPKLANLAIDLEHAAIPRDRFHERAAAAPLPRAFQWAEASALVNQAGVNQAPVNHTKPADAGEPLILPRASHGLLGARDPIPLADPAWGCDLEPQIAVIVGDVAQGASREDALTAIHLIGLVNAISLRGLNPQAKPTGALSPVFATPDELDGRWADGRLAGALHVEMNGRPLGRASNTAFDFGTLIAHLARTHAVGAGSLIGAGGAGLRTGGEPFLAPGDSVRVWMEDDHHHPIFGVIEQQVAGG